MVGQKFRFWLCLECCVGVTISNVHWKLVSLSNRTKNIPIYLKSDAFEQTNVAPLASLIAEQFEKMKINPLPATDKSIISETLKSEHSLWVQVRVTDGGELIRDQLGGGEQLQLGDAVVEWTG